MKRTLLWRTAVVSLAGLVAGACGTADSGPGGTLSVTQAVEPGIYELQAVHSGLCLAVAGAAAGNGENVAQGPCDAAEHGQWELVQRPDTNYRLIARHSGKCMVAHGKPAVPGDNVQQGRCVYRRSKWTVTDLGDDEVELRNVKSDLCAEVEGSSTADGANLQQGTCNGAANQRFRLTPVPPYFVTDPVLVMNPNSRAPLAATLTLETDRPTQLTVTVDNGTRPWTHTFDGYRTVHDEMVFGFYPSSTHTVTVTVTDQGGSATSHPPLYPPATPGVPVGIPTLNVSVPNPSMMEPGVTMFAIPKAIGTNGAIVVMLDEAGDIVWLYDSPARITDLRRMANGNLLYDSSESYVYETDMLGNVVQMWETLSGAGAGGTLIATAQSHHEVYATETAFLTISREIRSVVGYPTSYTDLTPRTEAVNIRADVFVEFARDGTILGEWHLADLIDPTRVGYGSFNVQSVMDVSGYEWSHCNAIIEDPSDDTIIISSRHQDAVVKFNRSGEIQWILGPHENWSTEFLPFLLTPANPNPDDFSWQYQQHAPALTEYGTLLLFDNGRGRASPPDPELLRADRYSRALEYAIDEAQMEVQLVWEYRPDSPALYSATICDADWLPNADNVLVTFGNLNTTNPASNRAIIREVTHTDPPEVLFEVGVTDNRTVYRAERLPSVYP